MILPFSSLYTSIFTILPVESFLLIMEHSLKLFSQTLLLLDRKKADYSCTTLVLEFIFEKRAANFI